MAQASEAARIHLSKDLQGVVTCLSCGIQRTINMASYSFKDLSVKALKVKCSTCQRSFFVRFDLRGYDRIAVQCPGHLLDEASGAPLSPLTVVSLSVGGAGLQLNTPVELEVGQHCILTFMLDDPDHTSICETVTVTRVQGHFVGTEFYPPDKYNHALDFYIFPALDEA